MVALSNAYPQVLVPVSLSQDSGIIRNASPLVGWERLLRERALTKEMNTQIVRNQLLNDHVNDNVAVVQLSASSRRDNNDENQRRRLNNNRNVDRPRVHVVATEDSVSSPHNGILISQQDVIDQLNRDVVVAHLLRQLNEQRQNDLLNRDVIGQWNDQNTLVINHADRNGNNRNVNTDRQQLLEQPIVSVWPQVARSTPSLPIITTRVH